MAARGRDMVRDLMAQLMSLLALKFKAIRMEKIREKE